MARDAGRRAKACFEGAEMRIFDFANYQISKSFSAGNYQSEAFSMNRGQSASWDLDQYESCKEFVMPFESRSQSWRRNMEESLPLSAFFERAFMTRSELMDEVWLNEDV